MYEVNRDLKCTYDFLHLQDFPIADIYVSLLNWSKDQANWYSL